MAKPENEMEEITGILTQEVRAQSERLATALFPKGPPGHRKMTRDQELDMVARHWHEPEFRKNLLMRMAPPGPNGYPDPELAQNFINLYTEAVLKRGSVAQDVPNPEPTVPVQGPVPSGPFPLGGNVPPPGTAPEPPVVAAAPGGAAPPGPPTTTPPAEPGPTQIAQNIQPGQPGAFSLPLPNGVPPPPEAPF